MARRHAGTSPHRKANELGYLILIGDEAFDAECPVFFGWAPKGTTGIDELMESVRFGYPGKLKIVGVAFATSPEVEQLHAKLAPVLMPGTNRWFYRCDVIDEILAFPKGGTDPEDEFEDLEEDVVAVPKPVTGNGRHREKVYEGTTRSRGVKQSDSKSKRQPCGRQPHS